MHAWFCERSTVVRWGTRLTGDRWAAAIFEIEDGKVKSFTKDWDQKVMQIQLGWAPVGESEDARWNEEMLRRPEEARERGE